MSLLQLHWSHQFFTDLRNLKFKNLTITYDISIERVRFYEPRTVERGSYVYNEVDDKKSFKLDEVNPRYFSEIIAQLEVILKTNE